MTRSYKKFRDWCIKNADKKRASYKRWYHLHGIEYAKKNREKRKARQMIIDSILAGKLEKQPCETCGEIKVNAHHEDYSKPLEIIWLCDFHHRERHTQLGDNKRYKLHDKKNYS